MAVKKTTAQATEIPVNEEKEVEGNNSTAEAKQAVNGANTQATEGKFIYIGPSLPTGLKENAIYNGSREEVEKYLSETIERFPQAKMLIIPTENLATAKSKCRMGGTLFNKYYNDLTALIFKAKED